MLMVPTDGVDAEQLLFFLQTADYQVPIKLRSENARAHYQIVPKLVPCEKKLKQAYVTFCSRNGSKHRYLV